MKTKNLKLAIIGSRGIPSEYGGFETFTEYLSTALVKKGLDVSVSCEYSEERIPNYNGVNLFYFPLKQPKNCFLRIFYEFIYDFYSLIWASINSDIIYMLGYSASLFFFVPILFKKRFWVNPDGLEWKRTKFNQFIKILLIFSERIMVFWVTEIIADSEEIKKYFDEKYGIDVYHISYGVSEPENIGWDDLNLPDVLKGYLSPNKYYLVVARLEPENNILMIVNGYLKSGVDKPLIIVGDFSSNNYKSDMERLIRHHNSSNVFFLGSIYEKNVLQMFRKHCFAYIHGHSVGGTNPSLLEAMMLKNLIIAHDNVFNVEVTGDSALYFQSSDQLQQQIKKLEIDHDQYKHLKNQTYNLVKTKYNWPKIIDEYYSLIWEI